MWSTVVVLQKKDMEIPMLLNFSLKGKPSFHVKFFRKMLKNSPSENPIGRERFNRKTVHKNYCYSNLWGKFLRLFIFQWMQVWLKNNTTAWKMSKYGVFLQSKSPYSVRIQENTDQKKLRIWTLFTQCTTLSNWNSLQKFCFEFYSEGSFF